MPQKIITPQSAVATETNDRYALWLATLEEGETPKDYEYFAWIRMAGHAFRLSLGLHPEAPIGRHPGFTDFLRTYGANGIPF